MAKIKVSQKTIDQIKNLGMTKALKSASSMKSNASYMEGLRRMYGAARVNKALGYKAATGKSIPVGGVMGTKKAQVMSGPVRSTKKVSAEAKTVKAFNSNTGQRVTNYSQGAQILKTQQENLNKRVKAMAPAERRAYYGTQAKKAAGFTAGVVSMVPLGAAGVAAGVSSKLIAGGVKAASVASKTKKGIAAAKVAAAKNVPPRSYAGIKTTAALGTVAGIGGAGNKKNKK